MKTTHYDTIYEAFLDNHPYMTNDVKTWRPKGDWGIRITTYSGDYYDYDNISKSIRKVRDDRKLNKDEITEQQCRDSFAYHLRNQMGIRGYTQRTLSENTGISVGAISSYINATKSPSMTNMRKIAFALDCSIAELLD